MLSAANGLCLNKPFPCTPHCAPAPPDYLGPWDPALPLGTTETVGDPGGSWHRKHNSIGACQPSTATASHSPPALQRASGHDSAVFTEAEPGGEETGQKTAQSRARVPPSPPEIQTPASPVPSCPCPVAACLPPTPVGDIASGSIFNSLRISMWIKF